ncbi:proline dehydrogenase family protein [Rosistilla oblonga]|uniref:proline dehydrogenase family protein n=1 Tax=Rosistilla oblonga TaxID=2527990 RepID=UPI003A96D699
MSSSASDPAAEESPFLNLNEAVAATESAASGLTGWQRDAVRAIALAKQLLQRSQQLLTPAERRQQSELDRMIGHHEDKATLIEMTDQAFRTDVPQRVADQLTHILDVQGVPRFFSPLDRTLLRGFQTFGGYLPGVAVPMVKDKMRHETANVILPAEKEVLEKHLRERQREGIRMNVCLLGEALLGEGETRQRLKKYLAALQMPEIECISVKVSTIYSQISTLARSHTESVIADRLELLYRAAMRQTFQRRDGTQTSKFVYLDMEEYRDLHLTVDVLKRTLDRPELSQVRAGIALQSYIPDSFDVLQDLAQWAQRRTAAGGLPLTIRVVKGANMEMERVEASIEGWPQAPYTTKHETDANYKRMIRTILAPENSAALRLGVASHNLFDIALAAIWATEADALQRVQFEMLEGMANQQRRALLELTGSMLLYAPACEQTDFLNAIGYLIRRLDENTGQENFLRHAFQLQPGTETWRTLADGFRASLVAIDSVTTKPRRQQDRSQVPERPEVGDTWQQFINEPNTDWSLPQNSRWAQGLLASWRDRCDDAATRIPLSIAGREVTDAREIAESRDPSRPGKIACRYAMATSDDIDTAIACARQDPRNWRSMPSEARCATLRDAAQLLRQRRGDLLAAALIDGGKTLAESDPEVSEAIDFIEFYSLCADQAYQSPQIQASGVGVVAVISPWNFPIAIPCGGVAAALAAGNTVLLKPASETVLPAYLLCQAFWDAGVPREALQLVPCRGSDAGRRLVENPEVDIVILTGGTETAESMLRIRPDLALAAETGGKNATIVTGLSDRELAIKHVLQSAFGHSGQKCSATSLLLLEDEVFEDESFREMLADACKSLIVGSPWELQTRVGPLIRPPSGELARGLKELEPGESWLVMPEPCDDNPNLYRPGIKWNVQPGSFTHMTELFGPVLGVMPFRKLEQAIRIVNATGFGLTSGLESLDDREQELWREQIQAGNLYINRSTTGAIVLRQPFGGLGKSAFGPGIKAGGPHYVASLMKLRDQIDHPQMFNAHRFGLPALQSMRENLKSPEAAALIERCGGEDATESVIDRLQTALASYDHWATEEYRQQHDSVRLVGQDNWRRYCPIAALRIGISAADGPLDIVRCIAAAHAAGCRITLSHRPGEALALVELVDFLTADWAARIEMIEETTQQWIDAIEQGEVLRIRMTHAAAIEPVVREAANQHNVYICQTPVLSDGRYELLHYVREQSVCVDYHRYGNLGRRSEEPRRHVL